QQEQQPPQGSGRPQSETRALKAGRSGRRGNGTGPARRGPPFERGEGHPSQPCPPAGLPTPPTPPPDRAPRTAPARRAPPPCPRLPPPPAAREGGDAEWRPTGCRRPLRRRRLRGRSWPRAP
ncbi:unnamed protein product, partial [Ectocarpus sp. 8 AP-2014]